MRIYIEQPEFETRTGELALFEKMKSMKYQIMWALRSLEDEMNDSEGMIIVRDTGAPEVINFEIELHNKIVTILNRLQYE